MKRRKVLKLGYTTVTADFWRILPVLSGLHATPAPTPTQLNHGGGGTPARCKLCTGAAVTLFNLITGYSLKKEGTISL
jgi:hypothetical protein